LQAKFDARGLRQQIEDVVGNRVLDSADLITGYCVITKRMDTGGPWIISNNPRAPYWQSRTTGDIGNKNYPLVNLVRASTAAPHFFNPELLPISRDQTLLPDAVAKPLNTPGRRAPRRRCCGASDSVGTPRSIRAPMACSSTAGSRRTTIPRWHCSRWRR
jgi:hypothetical protein